MSFVIYDHVINYISDLKLLLLPVMIQNNDVIQYIYSSLSTLL